MNYYRALNELSEIQQLERKDIISAIQICVERLEFYEKHAPGDLNFGVYIDKCRQLLPTIIQLADVATTYEDRLRLLTYKTRIFYIFDRYHIYVPNISR